MTKPLCKRCGREKGSEICIAWCGKPEGEKPAEADDPQLHVMAFAPRVNPYGPYLSTCIGCGVPIHPNLNHLCPAVIK